MYPAVLIGVFLVAFVGTYLMRRYALRKKMLDTPNARSSHTTPTPRGGGVAIVIAATAGFSAMYVLNLLAQRLFLVLTVGGLLVALVGYLDDRKSLPVKVRMLVHTAAALFGVCFLGRMPVADWGAGVVDLGAVGYVLAALAVIWMLNLFNFMDGIDGLAASQAVFVAGAGAILCIASGDFSATPAAAVVVTVASLGFLLWNWPPARIFMGDAGSGYLGYLLAALTLAAAHENHAWLFSWVILSGVFIIDATTTLVRRLVRGERVYEAHRSHAYQRLARRLGSHRAATCTIVAINMCWLFPCAWLAMRFPDWGIWIAAAALMPLVLLAWREGAGTPESTEPYA